ESSVGPASVPALRLRAGRAENGTSVRRWRPAASRSRPSRRRASGERDECEAVGAGRRAGPRGVPSMKTLVTGATGFVGSDLDGAARGLWAVSLHPGLLFGERDVHFHAAWVLAGAADGGILSRLCAPGGLNVADVRDVARAHLLALERGRAGASYLVGGRNLT